MTTAKCKTGRYVTPTLGVLIKLVETDLVSSPPLEGFRGGAMHAAGRPSPKGEGEETLVCVRGQHKLKPVPLSRLILASV